MPSYRYLRDIEPEQKKPEEQKEYTKQEKLKNWWTYHWGWVAGGIAAAALLASMLVPVFNKVTPDATFGILSPAAIPDSLVAALESGLAEHIGDRNGDGKAVVSVETFIISLDQGESESGTIVDPNLQMAGIVRLTGALSSGDPILYFIAEDGLPEFQDAYGIIGSTDGSSIPEGSDEWKNQSLAWNDSAILTSLDLPVDVAGSEAFDGQLIMQHFRLANRPFDNTALSKSKDGAEKWQNGLEIFQMLAAK